MTATIRSIAQAVAVAGAAALALPSFAGSAEAAECDPGKPGTELTHEEAEAVYACLKDELHAGYIEGDKKWIPVDVVRDYRDWTPVSELPAAPGFHGGRFLLTYVNDAGDDEYLKFLEERGPMPAGTLIAKESFAVNDAGEVEKGPLFFMEKVAAGVSPETEDWYYYAVAADGTPMAFDVITACSECHQGNFGYRDGLGYPVPEVRAGN